MGGHQAQTWAVRHGDRVRNCVLLATSPRLTSQALAFDVVGRNAILRDPHFHGGQYYDQPTKPAVGLALARMLGHITYLSREGMTAKFDPVRDKPRDVAQRLREALRRRLLPRPPGRQIRRAVRRQQLRHPHPRDGRLRPRRLTATTLTRIASARRRAKVDTVRRGELQQRLAVPAGAGEADRRGIEPCGSSRELLGSDQRRGTRRLSLLPDEADQYGPFVEAMLVSSDGPDCDPLGRSYLLQKRRDARHLQQVAATQRVAVGAGGDERVPRRPTRLRRDPRPHPAGRQRPGPRLRRRRVAVAPSRPRTREPRTREHRRHRSHHRQTSWPPSAAVWT